MKRLAVLFLLSTCAAASADEDTSWHLLTQTVGGTMQLVKSLSKSQCEFMLHRAKGEPATQEEKDAEKRRQEKEAAVAAEYERTRKVKEEVWRIARPECFPKDKDGNDKTVGYWTTSGDGSLPAICQKRYEISGYAVMATGRYIQPSDIRSAECFQ